MIISYTGGWGNSIMLRSLEISEIMLVEKIIYKYISNLFINPSFTRVGGRADPLKGFSSITFEKIKLEIPNFV